MSRARQGAAIGGAVLVALAVAGYFHVGVDAGRDAAPIASAPPAADVVAPALQNSPVAAAPAPDPEPESLAPSFDVVRVNRAGDVVAAGRAQPGAEVVLKADGDAVLGRATADSRGEWVLLPDQAIAPGVRALSLEAQGPDAGVAVASEQVVTVVVPERGEGEAIAIATPTVGGPSTPLQAPGALDAAVPKVAIDVIDYDDAGGFSVGGPASPGDEVRLYVNDEPAGAAVAADDGRWRLIPETDVPTGLHRLRVDQVDETGDVVARAEIPFQRVENAAPPSPDSIVVQPGTSLWRIARNVYGRGVQYTVIYEANREQIRDPDLIYPGQIFTLPAADRRG